jgi:DNA gyrase subunit A
MEIVRPEANLLTVTANGFGKRTLLTEYRAQTRGGKGIINIKVNKRNGLVVAVQMIKGDEEIMMVSAEGIVIRFNAEDISKIGRATQGVTLMRLDKGDIVVAVAKVLAEE